MVASLGELQEERVLRKFGNPEFALKPTNFHNLDLIVSVGYRVKSLRGTQFHIWATERLREFFIKGFTMVDQRLKEAWLALRKIVNSGSNSPLKYFTKSPFNL